MRRARVCASCAMATSLCPTPTVSMMMTSKPNASIITTASAVAPASPPKCPRLAIERMKTSRSVKCSAKTNAIAQQRAVRKGRTRIHRYHARAFPERTDFAHQRRGQRRFAYAGRTGQADRSSIAGLRIERANEIGALAGLRQRDGACERSWFTPLELVQ